MENQNQQTQPPQSPIQTLSVGNSPNKSKLVPIVLGVAAVIAISIGPYVLGAKQSQPVFQNSVQSTPIPSPNPTVDETASSKTYTNTKYNFTFKYPITWQIEEVNGNSLRIAHLNDPPNSNYYEVVSWYINYQDLQNAKRFIYDNKLQKWGHLTWDDYYNATGSGKFEEIDQLFTTETGNPVYCLSKEGGADQLITLSTNLFIVIDMGTQRCIRDSTYPPPEDKIYKIIQSFNLISP